MPDTTTIAREAEPVAPRLSRGAAAAAAAAAAPREPRTFLCKYRPLAYCERGRQAATDHRLAPFTDASCRREPDLEHEYPAISAISEAAVFASRLREGDVVVYITFKGDYGNFPFGKHWRLPAILKVLHKFETHEAAAEWYREQNLPLPSNCLVEGNPPIPLERTCQVIGDQEGKELPVTSLLEWDNRYQQRAAEQGAFLVCKPLFLNLRVPRVLTADNAKEIFRSREMSTRTPGITREAMDRLLQVCGVRIDAEELPV